MPSAPTRNANWRGSECPKTPDSRDTTRLPPTYQPPSPDGFEDVHRNIDRDRDRPRHALKSARDPKDGWAGITLAEL
jgi:hypothetical protein